MMSRHPESLPTKTQPVSSSEPAGKEVDVLIRGQGLAGTLLAWELERAAVAFAIADDAQAPVASLAAAGIINPITGRRLVKTWQIDTLLPLARESYAALEHELGVRLWHDMRVRRLFADERERATLQQKSETGELAPFLERTNGTGFWIRGAARVDFATLLSAARTRWERQGRLVAKSAVRARLTIDCTGAAVARASEFAFVPWEFSKGEVLEIAVDGLAPDVIFNRRQWVLPVGDGTAWVGATHEPGVVNRTPSHPARAALASAARAILGRDFEVTGQRAGVRVHLPDKLPVAGRHPGRPELGLINGLGGKGALFAPLLARAWANHLTRGEPFDPALDVARFCGTRSTAAASSLESCHSSQTPSR